MIPDANRSILRTVAILGALSLGFCLSPAAAQVVPWQQPPGSQPCPAAGQLDPAADAPIHPSPGESIVTSSGTNSLDTPGCSPAPWANQDYEQEGDVLGFRRGDLSSLACASVHDRFWARGEFLAWWTKGFATPPLLTTSPSGTDPTEAGVLGAAGATVLLGGKDLSGGFRPADRVSMGAWLDGCQTWEIEASYLQITRVTDFYSASGATTPILARPFFNVESGQQDSQLVNYPGLQSGTFAAAASSTLQVAEFLVRRNLSRQPGVAFDVVAGYRYQQLQDHLEVDDVLTFSGTQSGFPSGSVVQQSDIFNARNVFQGGVIGAAASLDRGRWSIDTVLKIAVGQTNSRVTIEGSTETAIPGQAATSAAGGLLALPSNIGVHDSDRMSVVPELGITLGWSLSPQLRATLGYDLVYWDGVARPGDQIDPNIDPRQFPPPVINGSTRPEFVLHTSDYWAQGVTVGLDLRF